MLSIEIILLENNSENNETKVTLKVKILNKC